MIRGSYQFGWYMKALSVSPLVNPLSMFLSPLDDPFLAGFHSLLLLFSTITHVAVQDCSLELCTSSIVHL